MAILGLNVTAPGAFVSISIKRLDIGADKFIVKNIIFPDITNVKGGNLTLPQGKCSRAVLAAIVLGL
ncbi:MAG: hypothetical protein R2865_09580 [Deinococcales bacterium]